MATIGNDVFFAAPTGSGPGFGNGHGANPTDSRSPGGRITGRPRPHQGQRRNAGPTTDSHGHRAGLSVQGLRRSMANIGNDIFFAALPELNQRLAAKEFSAEDLARAFAVRLGQLDRKSTRLNSS